MEHERLDFVDVLPVEVVEVIFQNLSSQDLVNCSLVSVKWREVINNNSIWVKLCMREKIHNREHLERSHTLFRNPLKAFRPIENKSDRLSNVCYWRTHYDRYKYLKNNWRTGHCALHRLDISNHTFPTFYSDGVLVIVYDDHFEVHTLSGDMKKLTARNFQTTHFHYRNLPIDAFLVNKDMLIYSQKSHIIGLKLDGHYKKVFVLDAENHLSKKKDQISDNNNGKKMTCLFIKRADNFLIVVDNRDLSQFLIWNINGNFERVVQLEEGRNSHLSQFNFCEVLNMKVYMAYSNGNYHYVREYDLVKNKWGGKVSVPHRIKKLFVTPEILCAKLVKMMDLNDFFIWSLKDMSEVSVFSVNEDKPIALTDNSVVHCMDSKIKIQGLETPFLTDFKFHSDVIVNMFAVNNQLLVINTGDAIEVWDWRKGEKLYTPYRGICSSNMWVDEKMIIISRWSCNFQIIGFW